MANDDRQSDTFIREVDEELRRAQLKQLWDRFGFIFIGICVLVVLLTAGYRGWIWYSERQAAQAGDRFLAALEQIQSGNQEEGEAALQAIAAEGSRGYAVLARLRLAAEQAAAGQKAEALKAYDSVANDTSLSDPMRALASIRGALLALDEGDAAGAKDRAEPLNVSGNPWRHVAREVIGTADYDAGDLEAAREVFSEIQRDAETPPDLWVRSGMMVSLIDGQLAPPGSGAAAGETAPADAAASSTTPAEPEQSLPQSLELPADTLPAAPSDFSTQPASTTPGSAPPTSEDATPAPAAASETEATTPQPSSESGSEATEQ